MALKPHEKPPSGFHISPRTAQRWRSAGCDFTSAASTLAWAEQAREAGVVRIQGHFVDQLRQLCSGLPKAREEVNAVGLGEPPAEAARESVDFDAAGESSILEAIGVLRKTVGLRAERVAEAWRSGSDGERDAAEREFAKAAESLRRLEKDAALILRGQGDLWMRTDVMRAVRIGFGRVRAAIDGLRMRRPELAEELDLFCGLVSAEPLLRECLEA